MHTIDLICQNIPEETRFAVFDDQNRAAPIRNVLIPVGNSTHVLEIPGSWKSPHQIARSTSYYIPNSRRPIDSTATTIKLTGADYYIEIDDGSRAAQNNLRSVETLIYAVGAATNLSGRQQFYVSLLAANSYFEYLVHGMLVLSGHMSTAQFNKLKVHEHRIKRAFSQSNSEFFAPTISVAPGKRLEISPVLPADRTKCAATMQRFRRLRNDVAHKWGYRDISRDELASAFTDVGEPAPVGQAVDDYCRSAAQRIVRIYARTSNPLNARLALFAERQVIESERGGRL